jgi:hypothetical protein
MVILPVTGLSLVPVAQATVFTPEENDQVPRDSPPGGSSGGLGEVQAAAKSVPASRVVFIFSSSG